MNATEVIITYEQLFASVMEQIVSIAQGILETTKELEELTERLQRLPLTTSDYALCLNRLGNIRQYCESDEPGAANYELRLLAGHLQRL